MQACAISKLSLALFSVICHLLFECVIAAATQTAVSIPVRADWLGYDGYWSPVSIRVGTPPQWVDVFVSTANQETWVIGPGGCDGTTKCTTERGGIFTSDESSTWVDKGPFVLGLDPQLGFGDNGTYGLDTIALNESISVPSQIVGVVNTTDYWLGFLGLGAQPTYFNQTKVPTLLDSMVENQSIIPSHSYGFTAGAHYRLKSVPASLTLGGFDASRFEPNNVSFELGPNMSPVIAINSITVSADPLATSNVSTSWEGNSMELLGPAQANLFSVDTSTPYLWLPEEVCLQFENAFGLTYDDNLQLYTFGTNTSQHEVLVNWNLTFQFLLADIPGSSKSINLHLPYGAFDLQLSYPFPGLNATEFSPAENYFPLRKAVNSTQYTIGRAFLQETYLKVDYERNNFSIHQANFSLDPLINMDLIDISRPSNSTWAGPQIPESRTLSSSAIVGITIGALAVVGTFMGVATLCFRFRRKYLHDGYTKENGEKRQDSWKNSNNGFVRWVFRLPKPGVPVEIGGSHRFALEAPSEREVMELPTKTLDTEFGENNADIMDANRNRGVRVINAIGHDPRKPVELPYRSSARGFFEPEANPISSGHGRFGTELAPKIRFHYSGLSSTIATNRQFRRQDTQTTTSVSSPSTPHSKPSSKEEVSPDYVVSPVSPREERREPSSLSTIARRAAWYVANDSVSSESYHSGASPQGTISPEETPIEIPRHDARSPVMSFNGNPSREDVATNAVPVESDGSQLSGVSTGTNEIRQSVTRGFSWEGGNVLPPWTPAYAATEQSPYSPARWIEFWRTGRDPRLGPASERRPSRANGS